jgi:hypothetical protein
VETKGDQKMKLYMRNCKTCDGLGWLDDEGNPCVSGGNFCESCLGNGEVAIDWEDCKKMEKNGFSSCEQCNEKCFGRVMDTPFDANIQYVKP